MNADEPFQPHGPLAPNTFARAHDLSVRYPEYDHIGITPLALLAITSA